MDDYDELNLRVRIGMSGQELPGITVFRCRATASAVREAIAKKLDIEPIGLVLTVEGQVWAEGPAPLALWDSDSGAAVEVVRVPPTVGELRATVVRRLGKLSHNATEPQYNHVYLRNFDRPHFGVFADLHDAFPVVGYIGMARIFMLRTRAHQYLELSVAPVRLTDADVWKELVDDDDIWTCLKRVDRNKARKYLWDLHTSGEIDLGELASRWAGCQWPDATR
jgi:hypothetical protein